MDALKKGSACYVDVAMTLAPLAIRTENDSTLMDVIKAHGSRPLYEHARRMLSKRVHGLFLAGDYSLAQVATEHADYRWRTPEGETLLASLCGRVQSSQYQALQRGLMAQFVAARDDERPELTREFLRYGNYRGEKPAALVEAYGTQSMKEAVRAQLPVLAREYSNLYMKDRLGGELTENLNRAVATRALKPLVAMLQGEIFESAALEAMDGIVIDEMISALGAEFEERFGYTLGEKERSWFGVLFSFGANMSDIRAAFVSAEAALQKQVKDLVGARAKPKYVDRIVTELFKDPEVQRYIGEMVEHAVLAAKVEPKIFENEDTIAFSEVISELAVAEDLRGKLREVAGEHVELFDKLTAAMSKQSWDLMQGKMRQFYDLMVPRAEEASQALSALNRGKQNALTDARADRISKALLLRQELEEMMNLFLVVRRPSSDDIGFNVAEEDGKVVIETRRGLSGEPKQGAYVLPLEGLIDTEKAESVMWVENHHNRPASSRGATFLAPSSGVRSGAARVVSTVDITGKPAFDLHRGPASVTHIGGISQFANLDTGLANSSREGGGMTMEDHGVRVNNVALPVLRRASMPGKRKGIKIPDFVGIQKEFDDYKNPVDKVASVIYDLGTSNLPRSSKLLAKGAKDVLHSSYYGNKMYKAHKAYREKVKKLQEVAANPASTEQEYKQARKEAEGALKNVEQAREKAADTGRKSGQQSDLGKEQRDLASRVGKTMVEEGKRELADIQRKKPSPTYEDMLREADEKNTEYQNGFPERTEVRKDLGLTDGKGQREDDAYCDSPALRALHKKSDETVEECVGKKSDQLEGAMEAQEASQNDGGGGGSGDSSDDDVIDDDGSNDGNISGGYGDGGGYYSGYVA